MKKKIFAISFLIVSLFVLGGEDLSSYKGKNYREVGKKYTNVYFASVSGNNLHRVWFTRQNAEQETVTHYGFADHKGIIKFMLPDEWGFSEPNEYGYGQFPDTSRICNSDFSEGVALLFSTAEKKAYIDTAGKIIFTINYTKAGRFSEGLAFFAKLEKCNPGGEKVQDVGYMNTKGEIVFRLPDELTKLYACCYFDGGEFKNGVAIMGTREFGFDCNSGGTIVIDNKGKILNYSGSLYTYDGKAIDILNLKPKK